MLCKKKNIKHHIIEDKNWPKQLYVYLVVGIFKKIESGYKTRYEVKS